MSTVPLETVLSHVQPKFHFVIRASYQVGTEKGLDPTLMAAISYVESRWGEKLRPPHDPAGYGENIPRPNNKRTRKCLTPESRAKIVAYATAAGYADKLVFIKCRFDSSQQQVKLQEPLGWGHGLMQMDAGGHPDLIRDGTWKDPLAAMRAMADRQVIGVYQKIKAKFPNISPEDAFYAMLCAYNTGPSPVISRLSKNKPVYSLDHGSNHLTYHEGYVNMILQAQHMMKTGECRYNRDRCLLDDGGGKMPSTYWR